MRHLIAILFCGVAFLLHAAVDATRPIELDEAASARAAAYAAYAAGIYLEDHLDTPDSNPEAAMEKYLQAMAGVDDPLMVFRRAAALLDDADNQLEKAAYYPRMRQILEGRAPSAHQRICLAIISLESNEIDDGIALLEAALAEPGGHRSLAYSLLGQCLMDQEDLEGLRALLRRLEGEPDLAQDHLLHIMRMKAFLRLEDKAAAAEAAAAVVLDPKTYEQAGILSELFDDLVKLGYVEMTDAFLERFLLSWSDKLEDEEVERMMRMRLREIHKDGNPYLFERFVDMALDMEGLSDKFWDQCLAAMIEGAREHGETTPDGHVYCQTIVRYFEERQRLEPQERNQKAKMICSLFADMERFNEAAEAALRIPLVGMDAKDQYRAALLLSQVGRDAEALPFFERLEGDWADGKSVAEVEQFYSLYSLAAETAGDLERAIRMLERGLERCPHSARLSNALGYTLANHNRDLERARALVEEALEKEPDSAAYLDSLAWVHFRQGRLPEAFRVIQAALAQLAQKEWEAPESDEIFDHLDQILSAMGHPAAACLGPRAGAPAQK